MNAAIGERGGAIIPLRILGPLEIAAGAPTLPRQAQVLLGVLLLRSNEVVSTQRIADEIWGDRPPESWLNAVQVYVSRTRKALGETGAATAIRRQPPGYVAEVPLDSLDVLVFEQLCRSAAALALTDPARAADQLREALALWRGPVLDGLTFESFAGSEIERLEGTRLEVIERRIDLDLTLGRNTGVVPELELLVDEHPFRESLRRKLVLALYRAGRQADALAECRRARQFLVDELGIEPGADLRQLERSVLRQDPAIAQPALDSTAEGQLPVSRGRRSVTAVCATFDTSGLEDSDPELVEAILARWTASTRDAIERSGGTIAVAGEGEILACFGLPSTREDDPLRACRAAVAARETHAELPSELASEIAVGIGVEIGELIVGSDGSQLRGPIVSTARRLAARAAPGEITLGPRVLEVVGDAVAVRDERGRGQATLVSVDRFAEVIPRNLSRPLVGRTAELETLRRSFERCVASGRATLAVVSGPAGIGKSRIVAELGSLVGGRATVLHGRCLPDEEGVAFAPLSAIVVQLLDRRGRHGLTRLVAAEDDPDEIVSRFLAIAGEERVESSSDETNRAVRKVLESLASVKPLVLAVDDLHWAEPAFLDLLEDIASAQAPIAVVCTTRSELLAQRPAWAAERPDWSSIAVGSLPDSACAELLAAIPRAVELTQAARQRIVTAGGGNPLFVEQLAAMDTDWEDATVAHPVPASLRALLAARLDGLRRSERDVLEIASILDDTFTAAEIVALLPGEGRASASSILGLLVDKEFLRVAGAVRPSTRSFVHPLIRTTCYDAIAKHRRGELHERYADLVDRRDQGIAADEVVAHHLERAFRCRAEISLEDGDLSGLAGRARERLALAGNRRFAQGDLTTAVTLLGRASTSIVAPDEVPAGLLLDLGNAYREAGRLDDAERELQRGVEVARTVGDEAMEWRVRASLVRVLLQIHGHQVHDVRALADETLARLTTLEDADGLAMAWWVQGWLKWLSCQAAETERALGNAIEWARRAGNERVEAHSVNLYLGAGLFGPLPVAEAVRRCTLMRRRHHDRRRLVASCARALAVLRAMQGRLDEARGLVALDRGILQELGQRYLAAAATEAYGMVELLGGDPEAAETTLRHGHAELTRMGDVSALPTVAALLAEALVAAERYDDALAFSEEARRHTDTVDLAAQVQWRVPQAKALAWRGRDKKALRVAQDAVRLAGQTDFLNLHADALSALAEVNRMQGNRAEAAGALSQAVLRYERKGNVVAAARANVTLRALRPASARRKSTTAEVG